MYHVPCMMYDVPCIVSCMMYHILYHVSYHVPCMMYDILYHVSYIIPIIFTIIHFPLLFFLLPFPSPLLTPQPILALPACSNPPSNPSSKPTASSSPSGTAPLNSSSARNTTPRPLTCGPLGAYWLSCGRGRACSRGGR